MRLYFPVLAAVFLSLHIPGALARQVKNEANTLSYIQFWNLCPPDAPEFQVFLSGGDISGNEPFNNFGPGTLTGYTPLRPGAYNLNIHVGKEVRPPVTISVRKMQWTTVLFRFNEKGEIAVQLIDDTYEYKKENPGTIFVYNYTKDGSISCAPLGGQPQTFSNYGSSGVFKDLAGATAQINAAFSNPRDKRPRVAQIPLPLTDCKNWAIVFITNGRGRISPKVVNLGFDITQFQEYVEVPDEEEDQKKPSSPSGSTTP